mmetsp:Transcript_10828/g.23070  ORF Transcript_10828/g.23070 Transcript_10828/m.23070 type:complete len:383 (+) Transcript_10828:98-1246(+)
MTAAGKKQHVLVCGGGYAGVEAAHKLARTGKVDVTLCDPKDYFELNFITPRALVDRDVAEKHLCYKFEEMRNIGTFVQAKVVELTDQNATLSNGNTIAFDYAIISSGSSYADTSFKGTVPSAEERVKEVVSKYKEIQNAKSVVVAGGHYVGCEMAAELSEVASKPKVTIVQSHCALMDASPAKTQAYVKNFMEKRDVKVLLDHRMDVDDAGVHSHNGKALDPQPDVVFWATGFKTNNDYVRKGLGDEVMNDKNAVMVDEFLRVKGHPKIFALGDANDVEEYKLAYLAYQHGDLTCRNILKLAVNPDASLTAWKPYGGFPMFYLTLGKKKGVMVCNQKTHIGWVPTAVIGMMSKAKMTQKELDVHPSKESMTHKKELNLHSSK